VSIGHVPPVTVRPVRVGRVEIEFMKEKSNEEIRHGERTTGVTASGDREHGQDISADIQRHFLELVRLESEAAGDLSHPQLLL
jgi:hypothetical protein